MLKFLQHSFGLSGPSVTTDQVPAACLSCGCKDLYQQADFKRSIGVGLMIFVSLICTLLFVWNVNWFLVWSPMLGLLFIDMILRRITRHAALCYDCGTIHRGISTENLAKLPDFDLETFDRIQYKKTQGPSASAQ